MLKRLGFLILLLTVISCSKDKPEDNIVNNNNNNTEQLPEFTIEKVNNPTDGEILVAPFIFRDATSGHLMILDKEGKVIKHKKTNAEALDFKKWALSSKAIYSYIEYDHNTPPIQGASFVPGPVVLLDENLNEIKRLRLLPFNGRTSADVNALDAHDFILLDEDHYIAESYFEKTVNNIPSQLNPVKDAKVVAAIIQEVKNGQVIWEWQSTDHPELYLTSQESNKFSDNNETDDYAHLNSVFIDPRDNNLICSFRHMNQILKINRQTGDIIWRLGGTNSDFPLTNDQKFYRQHDVTLADNNQTLLIFDNGSSVHRPNTRIVEFKLDEVNKTVTGFNAVTAPDNIFADAMGSVQKRGNTYFIGWGLVPQVTEMDVNSGEIKFDMKMKNPSYRAFKF